MAPSFLYEEARRAALNSRVALSTKASHKLEKEGTLISNFEVVNKLETCATDDVIAEADAEIMRFSQPPNKTSIDHSELRWANAVRCDQVNDEHVLNGNFTEGLQGSTRQCMSSFCSSSSMKQYKTWHDRRFP